MEKAMEQLVFRQIAFPVSAFDYLKDFQRGYEQRHGVHLTNNQAIAIILSEHKQTTVESEAHEREFSRSKARD